MRVSMVFVMMASGCWIITNKDICEYQYAHGEPLSYECRDLLGVYSTSESDGDADTDADSDSDTDSITSTETAVAIESSETGSTTSTGETGIVMTTGHTGETGVYIDPRDVDDDGDQYTENEGDCNDANAEIGPGVDEVCDPFDTDEDCSGIADDQDPGVSIASYVTYYKDNDLDGVPISTVQDNVGCEPNNLTFILPVDVNADGSNDWDCNDADATICPGHADPPGGADQNCDGSY